MTLSRPLPGNLKGKRIVVTALDLEQSEHRGIATYSKALIRSLKEAGAEVWLLTQFDAPIWNSGIRLLPEKTRMIIYTARVLDCLAQGEQIRTKHWLEKKIGIIRKVGIGWQILGKVGEFINRPRHYHRRRIKQIRLKDLFDNPYTRHERLSYLKYVDGLLCAHNVFLAASIAALLKHQKPVLIDLNGFDVFLTSCPLNLKPLNVDTCVQTVHDLIPLEYAKSSDNTLVFSHRLQACLPTRRIFVSRSTAEKFRKHVQKKPSAFTDRSSNKSQTLERIVIQPPSLRFPKWLTEDPDQVVDLLPVSHLLRKKQRKNLLPFQYLLFNSSVEPRKNLLFLVQAYAESNLGEKGVRLCVTGKLKQDDYSQAVKEIVKSEPGIILTGYINESTKLDLYLNALALLSPSLVEGFGIPVLDSACLGMPTIASNCDSHQEIQTMFDFEKHVLLVNTLESRDWAAAMESIVGTSIHISDEPSKERQNRIRRYQDKSKLIDEQFQGDLEELLA